MARRIRGHEMNHLNESFIRLLRVTSFIHETIRVLHFVRSILFLIHFSFNQKFGLSRLNDKFVTINYATKLKKKRNIYLDRIS